MTLFEVKLIEFVFEIKRLPLQANKKIKLHVIGFYFCARQQIGIMFIFVFGGIIWVKKQVKKTKWNTGSWAFGKKRNVLQCANVKLSSEKKTIAHKIAK